MKYSKTITLKNGKTCILRNGTEQDGQALLDIFMLTHAETDWLLSYADETTMTAEQEAQFLKEKTESDNEIEILAFVDGSVVGSAGIWGIGKKDKVKHRAAFGISVAKAYWGLGIGRALMEACIECAENAGFLQLELEVVAENDKAIALYKSAGFAEYGRNPKGFRSRLSGWQELVLMRLDLANRRGCLPGNISFSHYREEDYDAVCDFLIVLNQKDRTHINWNWARFEWMMEHPEFDKSTVSSIGLWRSEGKVVGAAIYDMYFGEAFCGVLPEARLLYPEILDYAYRKLKDDSGLAVAINPENTSEIRMAELAGFRKINQSETIMRLSLDRTFSATLPEGFMLREMDQIVDREALEWLFWQGFDHGDDREACERSSDHVPHIRKHFNKALSLSAVDPTKTPVSHCSLWLHPNTDYAYVEPVCTIPGYRGKGIASALLFEAFSRAKELGAKEAYVISDLPFYEKLGFEKVQRYVFYRKE